MTSEGVWTPVEPETPRTAEGDPQRPERTKAANLAAWMAQQQPTVGQEVGPHWREKKSWFLRASNSHLLLPAGRSRWQICPITETPNPIFSSCFIFTCLNSNLVKRNCAQVTQVSATDLNELKHADSDCFSRLLLDSGVLCWHRRVSLQKNLHPRLTIIIVIIMLHFF